MAFSFERPAFLLFNWQLRQLIYIYISLQDFTHTLKENSKKKEFNFEKRQAAKKKVYVGPEDPIDQTVRKEKLAYISSSILLMLGDVNATVRIQPNIYYTKNSFK